MAGDPKQILSPFVRPFYVMLKPVGARCNLSCRYCYYLQKSDLYAGVARHVMSDDLLERFTRQYINAQTQREVLFTWHGGEATLRPLSFYQNAMRLQQKYAGGHVIDNCLQTNGTILNEEWCAFLRDNHWLVGVSIDGPQWMHDAYRKDHGGKGTWERVMKGIDLLNRFGVEWNAMAVVNSMNARYPHEFYRFFKEIGCRYIQFTPIVERADGQEPFAPSEGVAPEVTAETVSAGQWGDFLCAVFDDWVREDVGEVFVQLFDATLANWVGVAPGVCSMSAECGHVLAMEWNGDVYSCDHFVFPAYKLGNISEQPLAALGYSERQGIFARLKTALPRKCRECPYLFACHGECPKNRLVHAGDGEAALNWLCEGYRQFFAHVAPYMHFMAREWHRDDGAPARVMEAIAKGLLPR
ncbi:MAG: anaerobic sulfatase-maturation protein [Prevotella sp.]|nr:anaerobic sulfatase-maturation protein [Prevotella sp.]